MGFLPLRAEILAQKRFALRSVIAINLLDWSGRLDLNQRPPAPQAGALNQLRHAPKSFNIDYIN